MMAAKGLLGLYRQVGAEMLHKRDRGRDAALGVRSGEQKQQRFGEEAIGEIEGLDLLEKWKAEQRQQKRIEQGLPADGSDDDEETEEEDNWDAWNVENDEDSDDSGGWINVESDDDINISDSDDEKPAPKKVRFDGEDDAKEDKENKTEEETQAVMSKLATTKILTPADLLKLQELRTAASVSSLMKNKKSHHKTQNAAAQSNSQRHMDDPLTATEIEGLATLSKGKATRAQKMALLQEHKDDREEHKSKAARKKERKETEGKSTTNKEKARKKNFLMTLSKAKSKGKRSLIEHRKILKAHSDRSKRGGRKGNY
jgi:protein SDA1